MGVTRVGGTGQERDSGQALVLGAKARALPEVTLNHRGDQCTFEAILEDNCTMPDAKDGTFRDAGKVGVWTKADSVVAFDDLTTTGR